MGDTSSRQVEPESRDVPKRAVERQCLGQSLPENQPGEKALDPRKQPHSRWTGLLSQAKSPGVASTFQSGPPNVAYGLCGGKVSESTLYWVQSRENCTSILKLS